jgi:hypothetical protein
MKNFLSREMTKKILMVLLCLMLALVSVFVIAKRATDPQSYKNTIQSIDDKKATVTGITTATITASTALAAVPGDATTPIANQIMDMGSYLLIVVCALVLEKSLLTVLGYLAFNILVPGACLLFAISVFVKRNILRVLALKIVVFALVISTIIPFSLKISDLIYESNQSMVTELNDDVEKMDNSEESDKEKSWWETITDKIKDGVASVGEKAKELVNKFIDVIALFIITYCAIPIIVFLIVIWFVKFLFNIKIPVPEKENLKLLNALKKSNHSNNDMVEK